MKRKANQLIAILVASFAAVSTASGDLIGHYTFDDPSNLGADSSAHLNDATTTNAVSYTASGLSRGAAVFPGGSGGYLAWTGATNPIAKVLASDFSFSLFLKTTQTFGNDNDQAYWGAGIIYADILSAGLNDAIPMALNGNKLGFFTGRPEDSTIHSVTSINSGVYVSLVVTWNRATHTKSIYVNGKLESQEILVTGEDFSGRGELVLGANLIDERFFDGIIDDLQVYNSTLTSSDVQFLSANPGAIVGFPQIVIRRSSSQIVINFVGVLQESPDLTQWIDIDPQPQSPWSFTPSARNAFFRARTP
jgi:hypothetical protein